MNYSFLPEAKKEFDKSTIYYGDIRPELGEDFFEEILSAIYRAMAQPQAWPEIDTGIRRCLTNRFPYSVLYHFLEKQQELLIVAVMHNRRKPGYWKSRRKFLR